MAASSYFGLVSGQWAAHIDPLLKVASVHVLAESFGAIDYEARTDCTSQLGSAEQQAEQRGAVTVARRHRERDGLGSTKQRLDQSVVQQCFVSLSDCSDNLNPRLAEVDRDLQPVGTFPAVHVQSVLCR
jgi:hypothetical protein